MKLGITILFLLIQTLSFAQKDTLSITADYNDVSFIEVVLDLEKRYPLSFYYDGEWVDSLAVSVNASQLDLQNFLTQLFDGTGLEFHLTENDDIILTGEHKIISSLREDYFSTIEVIGEEVVDPLFFENTETETEIRVISDLESREFEIGDRDKLEQGSTATISGYIRDNGTGGSLIGVSVFEKDPFVGTTTNAFGYFVLTLPKGDQKLFFKSVGMKETSRRIKLYSDGLLDVELEEDIISLNEIIIESERNIVDNIQTGLVKIDVKTIKSMPTILGDADIIKIVLALPGVQSVGEGASGFNVRGGATDQNLILLNDATVYNPNHLFGFFSAFNPDVIKNANLYKSGIQSNYGGRISSVLDIELRDGNKKEFGVSGGISPITGKVTVEGPIIKDTASFILSGRSTYSDWILGELDDPDLRNSSASFNDIITKLTFNPNHNNSVTLSAYHSKDKFRLASDTLYRYYNSNIAIKWRHTINDRLFTSFSSHFSDYSYNITSEETVTNAFELNYNIRNTTGKIGFNWLPNASHDVKFGLDATFYNLEPGSIRPIGTESVIAGVKLDNERGLESALHLGDEFELSPKLSFYAGLRYSLFNLIGPGEVFTYQDGSTKEFDLITDTLQFKKGGFIKSYGGPEYRFSTRYKILDDLSLKFSYDRTRQYINQLTNTTSISPTDTWRLSNTYLKPQIGDQYSAGIYKTLSLLGVDLSLEGYYKEIANLLEYKDGADLLVNEVLETDVINALGKSYGAELFIRKKSGKLNGWVSYTYSKTSVRTTSQFEEEQINGGNFFPSSFDRPHNFSLISNYKFNRRINISANISYNTGRPVTFATTKFQFRGNVFAHFPERNQLRIPNYFRLDLAINLEGNHRVNKLIHGSWTFSVYNLTGRKNAYSIFSRTEDGVVAVKKLSIFGVPIPTITYNFKF